MVGAPDIVWRKGHCEVAETVDIAVGGAEGSLTREAKGKW